MTHLRIELLEGATEYVSTAVVKKLYEIAINSTLDNTSNLSGTLHIPGGYAIYKTTLETMFPHFHLTMDNVYVPFNDPEFEKACVAQFSSDGIGMTMADFLAVTDNSPLTAFNGNTKITDMTELQYFTNIPGSNNAGDSGYTDYFIYSIPNLTTICIPDLILYFARNHLTDIYGTGNLMYTGAFYLCPKLENVHISNNMRGMIMGKKAGWKIMDLTNTKLESFWLNDGGDTVEEIYLPNTMQMLGSRAFCFVTKLKKVVVQDGGTNNFLIVDDNGYDTMFGLGTTGLSIILDLPSNTTQVHTSMFNGGNVSTFILRAVTPPTGILDNGTTSTSSMSLSSNIDLYVPDASVSAYQSNSIFSSFKSINGLSQLPASYDPTPPSLRLQSQS